MSRAVQALARPTEAQFSAAYRRHGDMGAAAEDLWNEAGHTPAPSLTLKTIETAFAGIAVARTTAIRAALLADLLAPATPVEAKYPH